MSIIIETLITFVFHIKHYILTMKNNNCNINYYLLL